MLNEGGRKKDVFDPKIIIDIDSDDENHEILKNY